MKRLRLLLLPFSLVYDLITSIRNKLFDIGVLKATHFDIPIIAVGNLSVGGTGKTPQIEYLIRLLHNKYTIATLSRGYKRRTKGFLLVKNTHNAEDVGDEPLQFFNKFGTTIKVAVDANRVNGIQQLLKATNPPKVVLLDDAFQHRKVKANHYILLTKYNDLYTNDFLLPAGNLRESRRGVKRAQTIIVTKCPNNLSLAQRKHIALSLRLKASQELFFTTINYDERLIGNDNLTIHDLKLKKVVLVTGIANPDDLLSYLNEKQIDFIHHNFPDHHNFSSDDIDKIKASYENSFPNQSKIILTTEKDFVRLKGKIDNLYAIAITSVFLDDEDIFVASIFKILS